MADYNLKLSQFHQRVWQDVLGLSATIDERGNVHLGQSDLRELTINLGEYTPEGMRLECNIFEDITDTAPAPKDLMRICNSVNQYEDAKLTVLDTYSVVFASVYLLLAAPRRMPDEELLRAVIGPTVSRIKSAAKEFAKELQKLKAWQNIVNDHLSAAYRSGMTADALFESYTSSPAFAEDRLVGSSDFSGAVFPAYDYARQRCNEMCAPGGNPKGDS